MLIGEHLETKYITSFLFSALTYLQVVYPLDVIRRRMQVQEATEYKRFSVLIRTLSLQELFYGLSATYLKVMPAAAVSLLVRDAILGRLNKQ